MKILDESFDLKLIKEKKLTPLKTKDIVLQSLLRFYTSQEADDIIKVIFSNVLYSYKFEENNRAYLIYCVKNDENQEFHFYNLDRSDDSAGNLGLMDNSIKVFSKIFNIIYKEYIDGNLKYNIKIIGGDRIKLYSSIALKVIKKYNLELFILDKSSDFFILSKIKNKNSIKSFNEFIINRSQYENS